MYVVCVWWLFNTVTLLSRKDFLVCFHIGCVTVTGNVPRLGFQSDSIVSLYVQMEIYEHLKVRHIIAKCELQNVGFCLCQTASLYNHLWRQLCFQQKLIASFVIFKLHHIWTY
jgi:hypothetical protein